VKAFFNWLVRNGQIARLDDGKPSICIQASTTKHKGKRVLPLREELAAARRGIRPADWTATGRICEGRFPLYKTLRRDFGRAGIEHRDGLGPVVHFHSKNGHGFGAS